MALYYVPSWLVTRTVWWQVGFACLLSFWLGALPALATTTSSTAGAVSTLATSSVQTLPEREETIPQTTAFQQEPWLLLDQQHAAVTTSVPTTKYATACIGTAHNAAYASLPALEREMLGGITTVITTSFGQLVECDFAPTAVPMVATLVFTLEAEEVVVPVVPSVATSTGTSSSLEQPDVAVDNVSSTTPEQISVPVATSTEVAADSIVGTTTVERVVNSTASTLPASIIQPEPELTASSTVAWWLPWGAKIAHASTSLAVEEGVLFWVEVRSQSGDWEQIGQVTADTVGELSFTLPTYIPADETWSVRVRPEGELEATHARSIADMHVVLNSLEQSEATPEISTTTESLADPSLAASVDDVELAVTGSGQWQLQHAESDEAVMVPLVTLEALTVVLSKRAEQSEYDWYEVLPLDEQAELVQRWHERLLQQLRASSSQVAAWERGELEAHVISSVDYSLAEQQTRYGVAGSTVSVWKRVWQKITRLPARLWQTTVAWAEQPETLPDVYVPVSSAPADMAYVQVRDRLTGTVQDRLAQAVVVDVHAGEVSLAAGVLPARGTYDVTMAVQPLFSDEFIYYTTTHQSPGVYLEEAMVSAAVQAAADGEQVLQEAVELAVADVLVSLESGTALQTTVPYASSTVDLHVATVEAGAIKNADHQSAAFAFDFGVPGVPTTFSEPVEMTVPIDTDAVFDEVFVRVQHTGEEVFSYNAISLDPQATCDAAGNISNPTSYIPVTHESDTVTFYTCKTSTYLGQSNIDPAGSCWEAKERDPAAADGVYFLQTPVMAAPAEFYCDMTTDGGGWVLIGRGREGWAWNNAGVGTEAAIRTTPTGVAAFTPAYVSAARVDELLNGGSVFALSDGVRLRRAANIAGTEYQEYRWNVTSQTNWSWLFDSSLPLTAASWEASVLGAAGSVSTIDTRDSIPATANTHERVFTWPWTGHNLQQGFSYGASVTGVDGNDPATYLWESATENHAMPFTQVYIRPQITRGSVLQPADGGALLWLDAQDIDGDGSANDAYNNGDTVSVWVDKSGNGHDFTTTGAGATQPQFSVAGFNGFPVIEIDATQRGFAAPASFESGSSDYTIFGVVQQDVGTAGFNNYYLYDQNNGGRFLFQQGSAASSDGLFYDGAFGPTGFGDSGQNMATWVFDDGAPADTFVFRRNGAMVTTSALYDNPVTLSNDARIGERYTGAAAANFSGQLAELIIYDRVLSDFEISTIERYLDCKWDITSRDDCEYQFTVYRGAAAQAIPTTPVAMTWDTLVAESADIARQADTVNFELTEGGHYLVMYSVPVESTGGANRSEAQGWLQINNTDDQVYGRGSAFIRRADGDDDGYVEGAAIVVVPPVSEVNVQLQSTGSNGSTIGRRADRAGVNILKLEDEWDYARMRPATDQSITSTWTPVATTVTDELDVLGYSHAGSTLTLQDAGHYLVTYNVGTEAGDGDRSNSETRLVLDGVEVDGTRGAAYIRGAEGANNAVASYVGIIEATAANQALTLEVRQESSLAAAGHVVEFDKTGLTIVKLPDDADYVRVAEVGGGQDISPADNTPVTFDTTIEEDLTSFDHDDTVTQRINIEQPGDYLFFHSLYNARTNTGNGNREAPFLEWEVSGSEVLYGSSGSYNRQSNDADGITNSSHSSAGVILPALTDTDTVTLVETNEAADEASVYQAQRMGLQGVFIPSLFVERPELRLAHYRWRDDTAGFDTDAGWLEDEDVALTAQAREEVLRMRLSVVNQGTEAYATTTDFVLQWGDAVAGTCGAVTTWNDIDTSDDPWELVDSALLTDGATTSAALLANAEGYTHLFSEAVDLTQVTNTVATSTFAVASYAEYEFAVQATDYAVTGHRYCFRLFNTADGELVRSLTYPELQIKATSTPVAAVDSWGEAGSVTAPADGGWVTVPYTYGPYVDPVIVGRTNTHNDPNEALVFEARNVGPTSAEVRLCDSAAGNATGCQTHGPETIGFIVVDADKTPAIDGVEAGTVTADQSFDTGPGQVTVTYAEAFSSPPHVFTSVQTTNGDSPIVTRVEGYSATQWTGGLCQQSSQDGCNGSHPTETIGWVAIDPNSSPFVQTWETDFGRTTSPSNIWTPVSFTKPFSTVPVVLMQTLTNTGGQDVQIDEVQLVTTAGMEYRACELDNDDDCDTHNTDDVSWLAIEAGSFSEQVAYLDQTHYRWYEAEPVLTPTTAIETENATATITAIEPLRLRMLVQNGLNDVTTAALSLQLQYAQSQRCDDPAAEWTLIGDAAGSTADWISYDEPALVGGSVLPSSLLFDGSAVPERYTEASPSVANGSVLPAGSWSEWDFSLVPNGADTDSNYCFRLVTDAADELCYTRYPEINLRSYLRFQLHSGDTSMWPGGVVDDDDQNVDFWAELDNTVSFGMVGPALTSYAQGRNVNDVGVGHESLTPRIGTGGAHGFVVDTNATDGLTTTVSGQTLSQVATGPTIDAINGGVTPVAAAIGTEQFGLCMQLDTAGVAGVTATDNTAYVPPASIAPGFACGAGYNFNDTPAGAATPVLNTVVTSSAPIAPTFVDVEYMVNVTAASEAGLYHTDVLYTTVGQF